MDDMKLVCLREDDVWVRWRRMILILGHYGLLVPPSRHLNCTQLLDFIHNPLPFSAPEIAVRFWRFF